MKKFILSILAFACITCFSSISNAGVAFLADDGSSVGAAGTGSGDCGKNGYIYTTANCNSGLAEPCPYDNSHSRFKVCCPPGYTHTKEECVVNSKPLSNDNCHGFYKCD